MKGSIPNKQGTFCAKSNILWIMQLTRNISKDDEQYLSRITTWSSIHQLYGWLCDICQNKEEAGRKNNMLFKDDRKI